MMQQDSAMEIDKQEDPREDHQQNGQQDDQLDKQQDDWQEDEQDDQEAKPNPYDACLRQKDAVMEPNVWDTVVGYIQAGGNPQTVVEILTENYAGYAQMAGLVCKWLQVLEGNDTSQTSSGHALDPFHFLQQLIKQKFNADKFAGLFAKGGSGPPAWLDELINDRRGRQLVYELSAQHENCLLFNFAIQKILYKGYEEELASMGSSLASYFGVYHRLLAAKLKQATRTSPLDFEALVEELHQSCANSQHTYCHAQQLLAELSQQNNGHPFERLSQELESATAHLHPTAWRMRALMLPPSSSPSHQQAQHVVTNLLCDAPPLRLPDLTVLAKLYSQQPPPPLGPLRHPQLLRLLTSCAFTHAPGAHNPPELRELCCDVLALAAAGDDGTTLQTLQPTTNDSTADDPMDTSTADQDGTAPDKDPNPSTSSIDPSTVQGTRATLAAAQKLLPSLAQGQPFDERAGSIAVQSPAACCGLLNFMKVSMSGKDLSNEGSGGAGALARGFVPLLHLICRAQPHLQLQVLDCVLEVLTHLSNRSSTGSRSTALAKRWVELLLLPMETGWVIETLEAVLSKGPSISKMYLAHFVYLMAVRTAPLYSPEFSGLCNRLMKRFNNVKQDPVFAGYNRGLLTDFVVACSSSGH